MEAAQELDEEMKEENGILDEGVVDNVQQNLQKSVVVVGCGDLHEFPRACMVSAQLMFDAY